MANGMDFYEIYFEYGFDIRHRRLFFTNQYIEEDTASTLIKGIKILESENQNKPIEIIISSFGGSLFEVLSFYDIIRDSPCEIITIGTGKIMSGGVLLLAAGDTRRAYPNSQFMIHEISYEMPYDKHTVNNNEVKAAEKMNNVFLSRLADCTGKDLKFWNKLTHSRPDEYFDSQKALEYGIIDKIIGIK